jgi:oligopeptide transport system substrate-binding protein
MWETGSTMNRTGYANPQYDKLIEKAKNLGAQPEKRWETMQKAEKMLLNDAVIIPTFQKAKTYLVKPYVKNLLIRNYGSSLDFKYAYVTKHEG